MVLIVCPEFKLPRVAALLCSLIRQRQRLHARGPIVCYSLEKLLTDAVTHQGRARAAFCTTDSSLSVCCRLIRAGVEHSDKSSATSQRRSHLEIRWSFGVRTVAMTETAAGKLEGNRRRESRVYSLTSVASAELSTTGGTPTSTPPLSPCVSVPLARPPTQGGGPLSSHPTTPIDMPGAWLSTSDLPLQARTSSRAGKTDTSTLNSSHSPTSSATPSFSAGVQPTRTDSSRPSLTPAVATSQRRRSSGVRKLLSLSSLRNSFKGPRNSPSVSSPIPISEPFNPTTSTNIAYGERPPSQATLHTRPQGTKRSASASLPSLVTEEGGQPRLRKRKSTGWFRRKSQIFLFGQEDGFAEDPDTQEYVTDSQSTQNAATTADDYHHTHLQRTKSEIPRLYQMNPEPQQDEGMETEDDISKPPPPPPLKNPERAKSYGALQTYQVPERPQTYHAPRSYHFPLVLPEVDTLAGGTLNGGSLGAEDMFASIGR